MDRIEHWNLVYSNKPSSELSWYEQRPERSLATVSRIGPPPARVIDVGAGDSRLIDALLDAGYRDPVALDVSAAALERAQRRLSERAPLVTWIVADVTRAPVLPAVDVWHDRAVLHFLASTAEQEAYAALVGRTVARGGHAVIATFAPDGPTRCSGLEVTRHDARSLAQLLGDAFDLLEEARHVHVTPSGIEQRFCWTVFRRR